MALVEDHSVTKDLDASYRSFSDLISCLEQGASSFVLMGKSLEGTVQDSIEELRLGLRSLEQASGDYAFYSGVPPEFPSEAAVNGVRRALTGFSKATAVLNVMLANAYEAMPLEAKALVPHRTTFELLVRHRNIYLEALKEEK